MLANIYSMYSCANNYAFICATLTRNTLTLTHTHSHTCSNNGVFGCFDVDARSTAFSANFFALFGFVWLSLTRFSLCLSLGPGSASARALLGLGKVWFGLLWFAFVLLWLHFVYSYA